MSLAESLSWNAGKAAFIKDTETVSQNGFLVTVSHQQPGRPTAAAMATAAAGVSVSTDFTLTVSDWTKLRGLLENTKAHGVITSQFRAHRRFSDMTLSAEALRILIIPNAGGNSVVSEVLSYEMLRQLLGAKLFKTEMEVKYFPQGGSITDYVVQIFDQVLGVSVTRAFQYGGDLQVANAVTLLQKKLRGVNQATSNSMIVWSKQLLHVWVKDRASAKVVLQAFRSPALEKELKSNTLVLVTTAENTPEIFANALTGQSKKPRKKKICQC